MPKVLLTTLNAKYIHLNLAIRILYDLNNEGNDLHWKEFTIKEDQDAIANYCMSYEVVCFSCYIWNITPTLQVAEKIKSLNPNTKILLGGPEVSYDWGTVIAQDAVDYIITGEGEIPFATFLKHYPNVRIVPNLVYKENGSIQHHQQEVQFDVQLLANRNPYQYDDVNELANKVCYIETSRGCPYKCEFCLASLDNKVRYLPTDTIKQNLLYLMQYGKTIKFLDRTFNVKKDFTLEIFQFILDHHSPNNACLSGRQVFQFEITADIVHPAIVDFIDKNVPKGLFRFEIGIQTVNQKSNLAVSRKQNFEKTASIIKQLQHKIDMHLDLIVGLPLDYWDDTKYSFEQVFYLYPPELQLGFLKFLKGTPVREKYEQYGYAFDPHPPYQIIESNFLSTAELYKITQLENALEIYWNKKRAFHTLVYVSKQYSIFDFLQGLGKAFEDSIGNKQYGLATIYTILYNYAATTFSNDNTLLQLITIDYYLHYKIKPAAAFISEVEKNEKFKLLERLSLNHHNNRYVVLPINFDWTLFEKEYVIKKANSQIVIEYSNMKSAIVTTVNTGSTYKELAN